MPFDFMLEIHTSDNGSYMISMNSITDLCGMSRDCIPTSISITAQAENEAALIKLCCKNNKLNIETNRI